jgi:hypothetical protein
VLTDAEATEVLRAIDRLSWTFARTLVETAGPHWYTIRRDDPERYDLLFVAIKVHGQRERWRDTSFKYLRLGGWRFWTWSPSPVVINRAKVESE